MLPDRAGAPGDDENAGALMAVRLRSGNRLSRLRRGFGGQAVMPFDGVHPEPLRGAQDRWLRARHDESAHGVRPPFGTPDNTRPTIRGTRPTTVPRGILGARQHGDCYAGRADRSFGCRLREDLMRAAEHSRLFLPLLAALIVMAVSGEASAQERRAAQPETAAVVRDTVWLTQQESSADVRIERGFVSSMFQRGGTVMYGILACSLAGVAIIVIKLFQLRTTRVVPQRLIQSVSTRWTSGDVSGAKAISEAQDSSIGRVLRAGLAVHEWGRGEVIRAMESAGGREEATLSRYLRSLGALAAVSPLLGILGTVLGMIKAFNVIAASGSRRPDLIASGISEALITTAFGLLVAIPLYLFFHYFRGKVERLLSQMEEEAEGVARNVPLAAGVPLQRSTGGAGPTGSPGPSPPSAGGGPEL
jgi:biopolymer transport protein ExbB